MTPTHDTAAALDAAIEQYRTAPMGSADRTAVDRAIAAHVEAEVTRRLAAAPEVEAAIGDLRANAHTHAVGALAMADVEECHADLLAAIAADKTRAVEAARDDADQLSRFANTVIRRVGARERGASGQTAESGTTRLLADAARRIDAMVARDKSRPTPDEARRLVEAFFNATWDQAAWGEKQRAIDRENTDAARTALLRALGVEA